MKNTQPHTAITIRKIPAEVANKAFPKRGQRDLSEYVEALSKLEVGDSVEVSEDGRTERALKARLGQAARQRGVTLKWAVVEGKVYFQVRKGKTTSKATKK